MTVIVAGGGIAGLSMALTCHQIGVPVTVIESVSTIKPLGVGINLQPNAVRELIELGLGDKLDQIGIATREWALVGRNGNDIWSEPRGKLAGYRWPQYSVHRGKLQMLLYDAVCERLGPEAVMTGRRVNGFINTADGVLVQTADANGEPHEYKADLLLGADGIHSAIRQQMHPEQGEPQWGGAIMWRGTCQAKPIRSGASFVGLGSLNHRLVCYPISAPDPATGLATVNWIAEITVDPAGERSQSDWNKPVDIATCLQHFEDWDFAWLNVPQMIQGAQAVFEYPMVDRDPVERWVDGRAALMGDAAHVMYPVGSNGASQAIVDARVLGAAMLQHGLTADALLSYEKQLLESMSALVLRNREAGPFGMLGIVDERCGGVFDNINDVVPRAEIDTFMANYKRAAGLAIDELNQAPSIVAPDAQINGA